MTLVIRFVQQLITVPAAAHSIQPVHIRKDFISRTRSRAEH